MSITRNNQNNNSNNSRPSSPESATGKQEGLWNKVKVTSSNVSAKAVTTSKNTKETISIQKKQMMITNRKKAFGIEYLDLVEKNASDEELLECIDSALEDIAILKSKVSKYEGRISRNKEILERKLAENGATATQPTVTVTDAAPVDNTSFRSNTSTNGVLVPYAAHNCTRTNSSNSTVSGQSFHGDHNDSNSSSSNSNNKVGNGFVTASPTIAELPDGVAEAFQPQVPDGVVEAFEEPHPEPSAPMMMEEEEEVVIVEEDIVVTLDESVAPTNAAVAFAAAQQQQQPTPSAPIAEVPVVQPTMREWSGSDKTLPGNEAVVY